jgi:hypothetical protein
MVSLQKFLFLAIAWSSLSPSVSARPAPDPDPGVPDLGLIDVEEWKDRIIKSWEETHFPYGDYFNQTSESKFPLTT